MNTPLVRPRHYRLGIDVDLEAGAFLGEVEIALDVVQATSQIRLDCEGLRIEGVMLDAIAVPWHLETDALIVTPRDRLRVGPVSVLVRFGGPIGAEPRGIYCGDGFIATHLQPSYARCVFPCFDDPQFRTTFDLVVHVPAAHRAISNGAVAHDHVDERSGKRRVAFATSPSIPVYLLAFASGAFQTLKDDGGASPLSVHALESTERFAFALDIARRSMTFYEFWLAQPYPCGKLDIVVLPRTRVAGMEHSAAIFLREESVALAVDASIASKREVANLVAHEVAHQWFGGLVTPRSWQALWLNEGFATWLAPKALGVIAPDLFEDSEEVRAIREALHGDAGSGARPLETSATSAGDIEALFDATAYRKGAALLRMLEAWLGEDVFRRGLQTYLARNSNAAVTASDLWRALSDASDKPVTAVASSFVSRTGAAHLQIAWSGCTIEITQAGDAIESIPVRLRVALANGETQVVQVLLEGANHRIEMPSDVSWIMSDADAVGYYRSTYLSARPPLASLSPSGAVVLIEDAWIALWNGESDLMAYLALASEAIAAGVALPSLKNHLDEIRDLLASGARTPLFNAWMTARARGGALAQLLETETPEVIDEAWSDLDGASDSGKAVTAVELLLANPVTRMACWTKIKANWNAWHSRLLGIGGRGLLSGLAAFSDPAAASDISAFLSNHGVPANDRLLRATLERIAGRVQFRATHQAAMDAFLMRASTSSQTASPRLRTEHALLAAMAAGFRGALLQRNLFDHFAIAPLDWMHTPQNLGGALASAERQLVLVHRGQPVVSAGDVDLAKRLCEDLKAAAQSLVLSAELRSRDEFFAGVAGCARVAAMMERECEAQVVFAALFDDAGAADALRRENAARLHALSSARAWAALPPTVDPTPEQYEALRGEMRGVPELLLVEAQRIAGSLAGL